MASNNVNVPFGPASLMPEPVSVLRQPIKILLIEYGAGSYSEREVQDINILSPNSSKTRMQWVSVFGLQDVGKISALANKFGLHPVVVEDILNTRRRPKLEDDDGKVFIILKALGYNPARDRLKREHVSLVIGSGFVLTFQEKMPDDLQSVRDKLQKSQGRPKIMGSDYLAYLLIDAVIDHYYVVLDRIGESIHRIDSDLMDRPDANTMRNIQKLKNELIYLRRYLWPTREVLNKLRAHELKAIGHKTSVYLRDIYEHVVEMMDATDTYRDVLSNMTDTYMSMTSNRINEVMKVLTIMGTIFMPLTFITGLWGMNFAAIPFAESEYGFAAVVSLSAAISAVLLYYFHRKGWI